MDNAPNNATDERLRRWRLLLGSGAADGIAITLGGLDPGIDRALSALYDAAAGEQAAKEARKGSLGASMPNVARWLGDIRTYFPSTIVRVMQQDAMERLDLKRMLMEPELLQAVEPDVNLVATLMSLNHVMPARTRETARLVVRKVVNELMQRLCEPMRQAVTGSLNRSVRNRRPRLHEMNWDRTIRANLKHYQPRYRTVIPEVRIGYGHRRTALRDIILCVDESGSMATSVVYASIFGAVMASLPALHTHLIVFDTAVADLSENLGDPVDLLFGAQLGGGTDIHRALTHCQSLVRRPNDTILVLISDLCEGGSAAEMLARARALVDAGVQLVALLALNDDGAPCYDHQNAAALAAMGVPVFACTPDLFPELMAAALRHQDLGQWAASHDVVRA